MNMYSQRMGRGTLNNSIPLQLDETEDKFSQTELACPPSKNVSLHTKKTIQSSSSQTHTSPTPTHETRTTQTDPLPPRVEVQYTQVPKSPPATVDHPPKMFAVTSPVNASQDTVTFPSPPKQQIPQNEETQRKNILLSKLRELDSKKEPPASQPVTTVLHTTAAELSQKPLDSGTMEQSALTRLKSIDKPPAGPTPQEKEAEKKKLLLARLMAIDTSSDPTLSSETTIEPVRTTHSGQNSSSSIQSWQGSTTNNLHRGKPAFFTEDDPFGKRKISGKSSGTLVSDPKLSNKNSTTVANQSYKPAFGRRARGGATTPTNSNTIFGVDNEKTTKLNEGRKESFSVFETGSSSGAKDYPWEKRVSLKQNESLHNKSMVFGPTSSSSLLPLRPKTEAMTEPDDIEEIVLS